MTYQPPLSGKRISIKADSNSSIETGVVTLASGTNVNLSQAGSTITVASTVTAQGGDVLAVGTIQMYAGSSAPSGWALCNGAAVSRTTFSDLFAAIGTTYGAGNGSTTFNLPDLRARVPIGAGTGTLVMTYSSRSGNIITVTGVNAAFDNEIQTGGPVVYTTTGTNIGGLTSGTTYYMYWQSTTSFSLCATQADAVAGNIITLTGNGTGTRLFTITVGSKTLGTTGGEELHTLESSEMPGHTHTGPSHSHTLSSGTVSTDPGHAHSSASNVASGAAGAGAGGPTFGLRFDGGANAGSMSTFTSSNGAHNHTLSGSTGTDGTQNTGSTGGSSWHNNLQPFQVVNYIIKTVSTVTGNGNISAEYLRAQELTDQTTNVSANDHIKFDTNQASSGGNITLDTATTYTTTAAAASIGRFTLIGGKTYLLRGTLPSVDFSVSGGTLTYQWYDATNSTALGSSAVMTSTDATLNGTSGYAEAIFTPGSTVLVELRIIAATNVSRIGVNGNNNGQANALIQLLVGTSTSGGSGGSGSTFNVVTKSANYTLTSADTMILASASGGNVTLTLPAANTVPGQRYYIKRTDSSANTLSIARTGSDLIDGATSASIVNQYTTMGFVADTSSNNWYVI